MTAPDYVAAALALGLATYLAREWIPLLPHYAEYLGELADLVRGEGRT